MGGLVFGKISEESFVVSWEAFQAQGSSLATGQQVKRQQQPNI